MRKKLVESDLVDCVIGIGKNLFYNSPMEACILICRTNKPLDRRGKVLFINAKNELARKNSQSYLEDSHIQKIAGTYHDFVETDGFSAIASLEEIKENNSKLSIPLYVRGEKTDTFQPVEDTISEWLECSATLCEECEKLVALIEDGEVK